MLRCPSCGSEDLFRTIGGYAGSEYRCKKCGYQGTFVVESDEPMPVPERRNDQPETRLDIPLWIRILAVIFLLVIIALYLL